MKSFARSRLRLFLPNKTSPANVATLSSALAGILSYKYWRHCYFQDLPNVRFLSMSLQVCQASVFFWSMSRTVCSDELFRASKLKVVDPVHPAVLFVWKSFCVCWVVRANSRERSCCLLFSGVCNRASAAAIPNARLHSKGPSTSPSSAPPSFGIGWTPSSSTKETARCFSHSAPVNHS